MPVEISSRCHRSMAQSPPITITIPPLQQRTTSIPVLLLPRRLRADHCLRARAEDRWPCGTIQPCVRAPTGNLGCCQGRKCKHPACQQDDDSKRGRQPDDMVRALLMRGIGALLLQVRDVETMQGPSRSCCRWSSLGGLFGRGDVLLWSRSRSWLLGRRRRPWCIVLLILHEII